MQISGALPFNRLNNSTSVQNPPAPKFGGQQRKIMTYNVRNYFYDEHNKPQKGYEDVMALGWAISKESPDVIALQEVGDIGLLGYFNRTYLDGAYPHIQQFYIPGGRGIQVAVMSKADIQMVGAKSHWEEKKDIYPGGRDILEVDFRTATGYEFTVLSVHLKSMRDGEKETAGMREGEAKIIAKIVNDKLKANPNANIIVAGDFNTKHESRYGKPVIETVEMKKDDNPDNDMTEVMLKDNKNVPTHFYRNEGTKLDYMYVSPGMLAEVVDAYVPGSLRKQPWMRASDHLPVVTVIEEETSPDARAEKPAAAKPAKSGQKLDTAA